MGHSGPPDATLPLLRFYELPKLAIFLSDTERARGPTPMFWKAGHLGLGSLSEV